MVKFHPAPRIPADDRQKVADALNLRIEQLDIEKGILADRAGVHTDTFNTLLKVDTEKRSPRLELFMQVISTLQDDPAASGAIPFPVNNVKQLLNWHRENEQQVRQEIAGLSAKRAVAAAQEKEQAREQARAAAQLAEETRRKETPELAKKLGAELKKVRGQLEVSQIVVGKRAGGLTRACISKLEKGDFVPDRNRSFARVARTLGFRGGSITSVLEGNRSTPKWVEKIHTPVAEETEKSL